MCFDRLAGSDDVPIVVRRIIFHGTAPRENDTFGAPASRIAGARPCERKAAILTPFFQSAETPADRLMVEQAKWLAFTSKFWREFLSILLAGKTLTDDQMTERDKVVGGHAAADRSEEHTSELQSLMRLSYAVFCLKQKKA